ncbi:MAG: TetR/AcrR family transcriptional regulator [Deltaproteobacteria bacterium]|nr:MAG: TetR/AcrR family transcriptional regulator [Deltaproteobacteria bacterium]
MVQPVDSVPERILAEATRLFASRGFSATSLQAIADAAGITKPTLVYHFGSKDRLRDAVIDALLDHWREELPQLMRAAQAGGTRLDALMAAFFAFFRRDPRRPRLLLRAALDRPDALRDRLRQHLQPWTGLLTQAIRAGQAQGLLRPATDPEAFTVLVISAALGVVALGEHTAALVSPEPSTQAQQDELIRVARSALICPPKET